MFRKSKEPEFCSAVVLAAGQSERMGTDKITLPICGVPLIIRALSVFESAEEIREIVVVTRSESIPFIARMCKERGITKVTKVLTGGGTRLESALAGVSEVNPKAELIAIHDAARALVTAEIISEAVEAAGKHLAAVPAIPARDTVRFIENGAVQKAPARESVFLMQTPQVFESDLIKAALTDAFSKRLEITDDCGAVEAFGVRPCLTMGSEENIKITTPLDLRFAEAILDMRNMQICE